MPTLYLIWIIVSVVLIAAIAGIVTVCVLMDKKDTALINDFIKSSTADVESEKAEADVQKTE
ncbi:MAG: hypothetical protein IKM43_00675 [Clostridia bacterium]|nr:hypothetical protein [Clostridia bacterium]